MPRAVAPAMLLPTTMFFQTSPVVMPLYLTGSQKLESLGMRGKRAPAQTARPLKTLADCSKALKEYNPNLEITVCVHATKNTYYVTELRGYDNWEMVAACPYFDVFSTTIINWTLPESFFKEITERTVKIAKKYGKQSERWLMGYNAQPEDFSQIDKVVDMYADAGVDRLATWTYRGGYGTIVAAPDPIKLWDAIGENYKRVLNK